MKAGNVLSTRELLDDQLEGELWRGRFFKGQNWVCTPYKVGTPPKTNMEPENGPLEKEIPIENHHFQVPC